MDRSLQVSLLSVIVEGVFPWGQSRLNSFITSTSFRPTANTCWKSATPFTAAARISFTASAPGKAIRRISGSASPT